MSLDFGIPNFGYVSVALNVNIVVTINYTFTLQVKTEEETQVTARRMWLSLGPYVMHICQCLHNDIGTTYNVRSLSILTD